MKNLKVLIAQKEDKTEFKIQEYKFSETKDNTNIYIKDTSIIIYKMAESSIIKDIEDGNDIYKTLNNNKFTKVKVKTFINESTKKENKTLITESNNTKNDNLNNLPTYE